MLTDGTTQPPTKFFALIMFAECGLITATWPLWFAMSDFPVIPLVGAFSAIPTTVDSLLTVMFVVGSLTTGICCLKPRDGLINRHWLQQIHICTLVLGVILALFDQQRLQPWHWLYVLISLQRLVVPRGDQRWLSQLTVASIYVFAGVSRLGPDISSGMTRQLATVAYQNLGLIDWLRNESAIHRLCILFVCAEIITGFALLLPITRKPAVVAAVVMHAILVILLSPWGLNHHAGVLVWNVFLALAVPLLFSTQHLKRSAVNNAAATAPNCRRPYCATALAAVLVLFPLSGLFGIADNWPAWQVYSPRADVARLFVKERSVADLPASLQPFVGPPVPLGDWCPVRIDRWALNTINAPLYPDNRLQLAVVLAACQNVRADDVQAILETAQPLFWRPRNVQDLIGLRKIRAAGETYFWNSVVGRH